MDCSPSDAGRESGAGLSKLQAGRQQIANTLANLRSSHWVVIDSTTNQPREIPTPAALVDSSRGGPNDIEPTGAEADLPAMLEAARTYIQSNHPGRTEIWICSDLRENDWHAESGRWRTLRDSFTELAQGVHFHLLAYPQIAKENVTVRVTNVRRQQSGERAELLVSLVLSREGLVEGKTAITKVTIPVEFQIEGARSTVNVEMVGAQYELKDYRIALEGKHESGWGKVSLLADVNPAMTTIFISSSTKLPPRNAIVVCDDLSSDMADAVGRVDLARSGVCLQCRGSHARPIARRCLGKNVDADMAVASAKRCHGETGASLCRPWRSGDFSAASNAQLTGVPRHALGRMG